MINEQLWFLTFFEWRCIFWQLETTSCWKGKKHKKVSTAQSPEWINSLWTVHPRPSIHMFRKRRNKITRRNQNSLPWVESKKISNTHFFKVFFLICIVCLIIVPKCVEHFIIGLRQVFCPLLFRLTFSYVNVKKILSAFFSFCLRRSSVFGFSQYLKKIFYV